MKWDWIFFDADETLFTFDSFTGLQRMFLDYSVTFTAEDFQDYQAVNKPLWVDYQNGAITSLQLQHGRFGKTIVIVACQTNHCCNFPWRKVTN